MLLFVVFAAPVQAERMLVLGDSLSAAHDIPREQGWVNLLRERLGPEHTVINASISGETTAGGLARLPALLERTRPDIAIVALGANDGLRGLPLSRMESNLVQLVQRLQAVGTRVIVVGMHLPPNYGPAYTRRFHAAFRRVAETTGAALLPFLLEGIATDRELMQADGLHPTAAAQPRILDNLWPVLEPLIEAGDAA